MIDYTGKKFNGRIVCRQWSDGHQTQVEVKCLTCGKLAKNTISGAKKSGCRCERRLPSMVGEKMNGRIVRRQWYDSGTLIEVECLTCGTVIKGRLGDIQEADCQECFLRTKRSSAIVGETFNDRVVQRQWYDKDLGHTLFEVKCLSCGLVTHQTRTRLQERDCCCQRMRNVKVGDSFRGRKVIEVRSNGDIRLCCEHGHESIFMQPVRAEESYCRICSAIIRANRGVYPAATDEELQEVLELTLQAYQWVGEKTWQNMRVGHWIQRHKERRKQQMQKRITGIRGSTTL